MKYGSFKYTNPDFTVYYGWNPGYTEKTGSVCGTVTSNEKWVGNIVLCGNVIITNGKEVLIDPSAKIQSNGFVIIVQNGGKLNTGNRRLPYSSAIGSRIVIS